MSRALRCLVLCSAVAASSLTCAVSLAQGNSADSYDTVDPYQTVLRALREGLLSDNEGRQHTVLAALRQLHDPTLAPLFERFAAGDRWALRVDSVLGLAELAPNGKVDLARIEQLPGERDRDAAITAVLALRLAGPEQVSSMLEWPDLSSSQRVLLAGELRRLGGTPDAATLLRLAGSKTPEVAAFSACILREMKSTDADALLAKSRDQLATLPPASRSAAVAQIAEACAGHALAAAGPFVASLLTLPDLNEESRMRALGSLLTLSPADAYPALAAALEADASVGSRLRYASILLASGARAPAAEWARIRNGDEALDAIASAGASLSEDKFADAYRTLVGLERRVVLRAAVDGAQRIGPSAERALGLACLELVMKPGPTPPPLSETLLVSLLRLAEIAPEELRAPLAVSDLDEPTRDALLLALLNAGSREAADVARTARGRSSRLGEGQVAVLCARHADKLDPTELDSLMRVAGGAVNVGFPVRMQAAWLWLRHSNKTADAIAALASKQPSGTEAGR